jgi:hypothetical protein
VGQKIDLEYNIETMRITDAGEEGQSSYNSPQPSANDLVARLKTTSTVSTPVQNTEISEIPEDLPKINVDIPSSRLKAMLNTMSKNR